MDVQEIHNWTVLRRSVIDYERIMWDSYRSKEEYGMFFHLR